MIDKNELHSELDNILSLYDKTIDVWRKEEPSLLTALGAMPMLIDFIFNQSHDLKDEDKEELMERMTESVRAMTNMNKKK